MRAGACGAGGPLRRLLSALWRGGVTARGWLRALSGEDAYERYRAHHAQQHAAEPLLSAAAFYADAQQRKWNGVSRCC